MNMMNEVFLLLGSNLGNAAENLEKAIFHLKKRAGEISGFSSVYKTAPWGFEHENFFLNQVLKVNTALSPEDLIGCILSIENEIGRKRNGNGYEGRIIDIDILFYNDLCQHTENLVIPHPLLHKRRFTLMPLNEIAPFLIHPVFKKTSNELLKACSDDSIVEMV